MSFLEIGASLLGGLMGSSSAEDAAEAQAAGTAAATAEQRRQFDLQRQDSAPYRGIGTNALRRLAAIYGIADNTPGTGGTMTEAQIRQMLTGQYTTPATPDRYAGGDFDYTIPGTPATVRQPELDAAVQEMLSAQQGTAATPQTYNDEFSQPIQMDPGYQFGMQQGQQALDRKAAASGGRVSGAALKSAATFGNNYASTQYGAAYQRRQDSINRLASLAGIGQSATNASAQAGQNMANNVSQLQASQGDANAASRLATGSIWQNAINQAGAAWNRRPTSGGSSPSDLAFGASTSSWW